MSDIAGPRRIDLNVDIGEGFGHDAELLRFATSANICCGVHAGTEELTVEAVHRCRERGVRIGAHPGYPDRGSMGRTPMAPGQEREFLKSIFDQVEWFVTIAEVAYLKPHGAFYNDTALVLPANWELEERTLPLASRYEAGGLYLAKHPGMQSLMMLLRMHKLPLMGLAVSAHKILAERAGQPLFREGFGDRAYTEEGTLVPRTMPGSVLTDLNAIREQVLRIAPSVDSICLHGDTEGCVEFAELVWGTLSEAGYEVAA